MRMNIFFSCFLFCSIYTTTNAQQKIAISGSVVNQKGELLQGATVVQTSTKNTTVLCLNLMMLI